jgi:general secretion pathway protein N
VKLRTPILSLSKRAAARQRAAGPSSTLWGESTFAQQAWDRSRAAGLRWAVAGALVGAAFGGIAFAPASWLASAVSQASGERLLLTDARGTIWSGSAVPVLSGGPGSRDATGLPGRLAWDIVPAGAGLEVRATQACCLNGTVALRLSPGLSRWTATLLPPAGWVGQWPSAWLVGLGTPWNTLQLGGSLRLLSPRFVLERNAGRWRVDGEADIELVNASSRLSTLETLGSYRLRLAGDAAQGGQPQLSLSTQNGALQLSGSGNFGASGLRFRGEARAAQANEPALTNLLNIIGQRDGARAVITIG